jgi:type I restriction enzyme S subunit
MSHYKLYSACKDSGIEWIGKVPEHWEIMQFKRVASIRNGQDYKHIVDPDGKYPVIGSGGEFERANACIYDGESVLLGRKGTIDKPLYINGPFWVVDTMFYTVIADVAYPKFVYYWALTIPFHYYSTSTALPSMTGEALSSHRIAAPKLDEQRQIARKIEQETARIDTLIAKKTRFIELLKEKRQALITHSVTKGLNPDVPMKDSGIEWIGEVPAHWDITPFKYISELNPKKSTISGNRVTLCSFLPMEKLKTDCVLLDETRLIDEVYNGYSYFADGDILIAKVTPCFENKNIAIANSLTNGIGFGSTEINTIRANEKSHNRYLYYRLQEDQFRNIAITEMTGTGGLKRVPSELFESFKIALPPLDEQKIIASHIDKEVGRIDSVIEKTQRSIELLKERRSAFINAAVTGQIDLREEC